MNKLKPFVGYFLFIGLAAIVFFASAFLVVIFRTKNTTKFTMPELVGKHYVSVHNELTRLRLKVKIDEVRFPDKNDGEILSQSIPTGKKIETGSKLYLTVNNGIDRVVIPDVRGQNLKATEANLSKVLSGEHFVNIPIGAVTYIPAQEGQSPDTVVDQYPEPGKNTTTREKIYLLVTETKAGAGAKQELKFVSQPIGYVSKTLNKQRQPWKIIDIISTKNKSEAGIVQSAVLDNGVYLFKVHFYDAEKNVTGGFEKISYKHNGAGPYKVLIKELKEKPTEYVYMEPTNFGSEEIKIVFSKNSKIEVQILNKEGKVEKSFNFD